MEYTVYQARAREVLSRHTAIIAMLMRGVKRDIGDDKEIAVIVMKMRGVIVGADKRLRGSRKYNYSSQRLCLLHFRHIKQHRTVDHDKRQAPSKSMMRWALVIIVCLEHSPSVFLSDYSKRLLNSADPCVPHWICLEQLPHIKTAGA